MKTIIKISSILTLFSILNNAQAQKKVFITYATQEELSSGSHFKSMKVDSLGIDGYQIYKNVAWKIYEKRITIPKTPSGAFDTTEDLSADFNFFAIKGPEDTLFNSYVYFEHIYVFYESKKFFLAKPCNCNFNAIRKTQVMLYEIDLLFSKLTMLTNEPEKYKDR